MSSVGAATSAAGSVTGFCLPHFHLSVLRLPCGQSKVGWRLDGAFLGNTVLPMPTLTFKVSLTEAQAIRARARAEKASVSAFLRRRVLDQKPARQRKLILRKHPVSGLSFKANPGRAVAQEEIDAALADFP